MTISREFTLTKSDAAIRQLEEAIILFFEDRDAISIHTLATASHQILRDIDSTCSFLDILERDCVKDEFRKNVRDDYTRKAQNFFKHADKDKNATIAFKPAFTEFLIFDATLMWLYAGGAKSIKLTAFLLWFSAKYPPVANVMVKKPELASMLKKHKNITQRKDYFLRIIHEK
ncbi:MAG: hypothetical protein PHP45_11060 [Elusimicrobiales bacterium]|nr:hypothetical protein [Elusimicrobiales bacterium]